MMPAFVPAQDEPKPADVLILHGINPTAEGILNYLEKGFSEAALTRGLPGEPRDKTQVVIFGIQELGSLRAKEAVPVLSQMCRREFPLGARQAMRMDQEGGDALQTAERRGRLEEFLVFNSMVALGWIGDPGGAPAVLELMNSKDPSGYITQGALALAMMGRTDGLPKLIDLIENGSPQESVGAARVLYFVTGRYYSLGPNTSVAKRKVILADAKNWFREFVLDFEITGPEVRRRRLGPYPPNPQPPDQDSIRGLCKVAANVVGDYENSFKARQKLAGLGADSLPELETVARDVMEDNDVRLEAIRYYVVIAGKDAKSLLKDLDDDENPPVAERALYIRKNLDEFSKRQLLVQ